MPLYRPSGPTPYPTPYCVFGSTLSERGEQGRPMHHDEPTPSPSGHQSYDQALTAALKLTDETGRKAGWIGETVVVARLLGARST